MNVDDVAENPIFIPLTPICINIRQNVLTLYF